MVVHNIAECCIDESKGFRVVRAPYRCKGRWCGPLACSRIQTELSANDNKKMCK